MDRMVAGGTGLIGSHLVRHWLKENISVTVVGRSAEKITGLFGHTVKAVEWCELTAADVNNQQVIVNLAGANILSQRWSSTYKKELLGSRVTTIKKLIHLLNTLDNPPLIQC
jgi:NAD dependent epimerase/dehydratase family enzyme